MKTSTTHSSDSRSTFTRFGKVAAAIVFGLMLCAFAAGTALADRHGGGHGGGAHHAYRGDNHHDGWSGGHWGGGYYAPGPSYYVAPEPYYYGPAPCYGPDYDYDEYDCGPPPPSGINLFFGR